MDQIKNFKNILHTVGSKEEGWPYYLSHDRGEEAGQSDLHINQLSYSHFPFRCTPVSEHREPNIDSVEFTKSSEVGNYASYSKEVQINNTCAGLNSFLDLGLENESV